MDEITKIGVTNNNIALKQVYNMKRKSNCLENGYTFFVESYVQDVFLRQEK